jgi:hypothetical protein
VEILKVAEVPPVAFLASTYFSEAITTKMENPPSTSSRVRLAAVVEFVFSAAASFLLF